MATINDTENITVQQSGQVDHKGRQLASKLNDMLFSMDITDDADLEDAMLKAQTLLFDDEATADDVRVLCPNLTDQDYKAVKGRITSNVSRPTMANPPCADALPCPALRSSSSTSWRRPSRAAVGTAAVSRRPATPSARRPSGSRP